MICVCEQIHMSIAALQSIQQRSCDATGCWEPHTLVAPQPSQFWSAAVVVGIAAIWMCMKPKVVQKSQD